jgi:ubiquinol-cytochrome c reductase cytochrome b subunit
VASQWLEWASDRFGWQPIRDAVLYRRVAQGEWYYGDGATLMLLLGVQVATGAVLMLTYSPSADTAYESVRYITERQVMGWFIRGLHYWSGGVMVVMLFFHLFREILVGGYKAPREGTWLLGVLMFFIVLALSYTGYLLRWDERAIYAIKVALHTLYRVPLIGDGLVVFVQGGAEAGPQTLTRFFAVHVFFLPLLLLFLVSWHLYLVMLHGITSRTERAKGARTADEQRDIYEKDKNSEDRGEQFYPDTMLKSGAMAAVVFAGVLALTWYWGPRELQPEANLTERAYPAEEWWLWWYSGLIALTPSAIAPTLAVAFPIIVFCVLVALPFLDRGPHRGVRKRPLAAVIVMLLVIALFYLTGLRLQSSWTGWPDPDPPPVPPGVELTEGAERGRQLFAQYGCNTCHPVAGHGWQAGPDLARLRRAYSRDELRSYILQPPEGVAMPSYRGRISDEGLRRVVEFVLVAQTFPREH